MAHRAPRTASVPRDMGVHSMHLRYVSVAGVETLTYVVFCVAHREYAFGGIVCCSIRDPDLSGDGLLFRARSA